MARIDKGKDVALPRINDAAENGRGPAQFQFAEKSRHGQQSQRGQDRHVGREEKPGRQMRRGHAERVERLRVIGDAKPVQRLKGTGRREMVGKRPQFRRVDVEGNRHHFAEGEELAQRELRHQRDKRNDPKRGPAAWGGGGTFRQFHRRVIAGAAISGKRDSP